MFIFSLCDPQEQEVSEKGLLRFFSADTDKVGIELQLRSVLPLVCCFTSLSLFPSPPSGCLELVNM